MINIRNWLALQHTPGVGAAKFHELLKQDPKLNELPDDLKPDWFGVDADQEWLTNNSDAGILTLLDEQYPSILKNIANPPPVLYTQGNIDCLAIPQIAMVGSRNPSSMGLQQARSFAGQFASLGFAITSGLAIGIDAASHEGALAIDTGKTIAVLAHGVDIVYPQQHKNLAKKIIANGCLVSEFPIGVQPLANHFPRRNRIISGLSLGVLVVEAALNSGSLITARYAGEQGREIFAIPGSIFNPKVKGCHQLIRQGAKLVESLEDVLEELPALLNCVIRDKNAAAVPTNLQNVNLSVLQERLLRAIDYEATPVDVIVSRIALAAGAVGALLVELELHGLISAVPGGYARKLG